MPDTTTCRDVQGADVVIHEFTDPACPWAYSAEPFRRRINWLYGEHVVWRTVMVGLAEQPEDWVERGYTLESMAAGMARISHDRWFLDRVATHVLAFEGDSQVTWFEGNFEAYEERRHELLGPEADRPHRISYKRLTRS